MTTVKITRQDGKEEIYTGHELKFSRDGDYVDVFRFAPMNGQLIRVNVGCAFRPLAVYSDQTAPTKNAPERVDPFTAQALEGKTEQKPDYKEMAAPEPKRKRRTKAEMAEIRAQKEALQTPEE